MRGSWDASVGIAMGYGLKSQCLIPDKGRKCFSNPVSIPSLGPNQPPIQWLLGALPHGEQWPGREAHHSPPSSAKAKHGGAIPSLLHMFSWHSA
jgi:hypothetical protein